MLSILFCQKTTMPNNQDTVNALLFAHNFGYIDDVEFELLYDVNRPRNYRNIGIIEK